MALEMVLNEHSLQMAPDVHTARVWMAEFVQTIKTAARHKVTRSLRTTSDIFDLHLANDYPLRRWLNDVEVNRDMRLYLKQLTRKRPPWNDLPDLDDQVKGYQFAHTGYTHMDPQVCGLWVSHLVKALAISLPSNSHWGSNALDLEVQWLEEEDNIQSESVVIIHASCSDHVRHHADWIENRLVGDIENGNDLWECRATLFPSLTFCTNVERQIRDLSPTMLWPVAGRLSNLQTHCEDWTSGGFNTDGLHGNPRPEISATLQMYGQERTFRCLDDEERTFSWHVSLTTSWRLYFFAGPETGKMIVGYVGPHLRTVKFN